MARILVIEDDAAIQQLLGMALYRAGHEPHYAFNGLEGHDKILTLQPDLITLDLLLPGLSGAEILKRVAANTMVCDIPIIIITGADDRPDLIEENLRRLGVREYIRKPFDVNTLLAAVRRIIAQYPRHAPAPSQVAKGLISLDTRFHTVRVGDRVLGTVSPLKAQLLRLLIESKGPVTRERLMTAWNDKASTAALEKMIQRLREDFGPEARRIQTTPQGYELIGDN